MLSRFRLPASLPNLNGGFVIVVRFTEDGTTDLVVPATYWDYANGFFDLLDEEDVILASVNAHRVLSIRRVPEPLVGDSDSVSSEFREV